MNNENDVWFYCKINPVVSVNQSRCFSWNGSHFPKLYVGNKYIPVFKNGKTDWIECADEGGDFIMILTLDSKKRNLCYFDERIIVKKSDLSQRWVKRCVDINGDVYKLKRHAFKIIEYAANSEDCYSPKSPSLLSDYKKMKSRISQECAIETRRIINESS